MRIRIVALPRGREPESVRKAWIGVELNVVENCSSSYEVSGRGAVDALEKCNPTAGLWWRQNKPEVLRGRYAFSHKVCQRI